MDSASYIYKLADVPVRCNGIYIMSILESDSVTSLDLDARALQRNLYCVRIEIRLGNMIRRGLF